MCISLIQRESGFEDLLTPNVLFTHHSASKASEQIEQNSADVNCWACVQRLLIAQRRCRMDAFADGGGKK